MICLQFKMRVHSKNLNKNKAQTENLLLAKKQKRTMYNNKALSK